LRYRSVGRRATGRRHRTTSAMREDPKAMEQNLRSWLGRGQFRAAIGFGSPHHVVLISGPRLRDSPGGHQRSSFIARHLLIRTSRHGAISIELPGPMS
jgi:hypothetical protein